MSSRDKKRSRKSKLVPRTFVEVENYDIEAVQLQDGSSSQDLGAAASMPAAIEAFEVDVKVESGDNDDWWKKLEAEATGGRADDADDDDDVAADDPSCPRTETDNAVTFGDKEPLAYLTENHPDICPSLVQFWAIKLERLIGECQLAIHTYILYRKRNEVLYFCETCTRYFDVLQSFKLHFFKHTRFTIYRVIPQLTTRQLVLTVVEENKDEDENSLKRRMFHDFITTAVTTANKSDSGKKSAPLKILYYKCYICCKSFEHLRTFIDHLAADTEHDCAIFAAERILSSHLYFVKATLPRLHEGKVHFPLYSDQLIRLIKCVLCKEGFESQAELDKHHNPPKVDPLQKELVNNNCISKALMIRKTLEKTFRCTCDSVVSESCIEEHKAKCKVSASLPLVCCVCMYLTKSEADLRQHQAERHTVRSDEFLLQKVQQCGCLAKFCGKQHIHSCPLRRDSAICVDCELTFQNETFLKIHKTAHEFVYRCGECSLFLARSCMLVEHRALCHDGDMQVVFQCLKCRKSYLKSGLVLTHIEKTHRPVKLDQRLRYTKMYVPWKKVLIKDLNSPVEILRDSEHPAPWSMIPTLFPGLTPVPPADDANINMDALILKPRIRGITELVRQLNIIKSGFNSKTTDTVCQDKAKTSISKVKKKTNTHELKAKIPIPGMTELVMKLKQRKSRLNSGTTDIVNQAKANTPKVDDQSMNDTEVDDSGNTESGVVIVKSETTNDIVNQDKAIANTPKVDHQSMNDAEVDDSGNEESGLVIVKSETDHDYFKVQIKDENIEIKHGNVNTIENMDDQVPMEIIENNILKENNEEVKEINTSQSETQQIAVKQESTESVVHFEIAKIKSEPIEIEIEEQTPTEEFLINIKSEMEEDTELSNVFQPSERFRYSKTAEESETIRVKAEPVDLEEERIILEELEYDDNAESIDDFIQNNSEITRLEIKPDIFYESDSNQTKKQVIRRPRVPEPLVYTCSKCSSSFMDLKSYLIHIVSHGNPKLTCPDCHEGMETMSKLRLHVLVHVRRNYVPVYTIHHMEDSDSKLTFSCNKCGGIVDKEYFWPHWESHLLLGEIKKKREQGDIKKKKEQGVTKDEAVDEEDDGETSYPGDNEPGVDLLPDVMTLLIKILESITGSITEKFCLVCEKFFMRNYDHKRHIIEHLLTDAKANWSKNRSLACQICNDKFKQSHLYKLHMRGHGKLPIYKCEMCTKSFGDSSNFAKHKKIHGLQTMYCDICKRKYRSKEMLIKHLERHTGQGPQQCTVCQKVFHFSNELKKHMKNHEPTVKSYCCGFCDERFESSKLKWQHEWSGHGERKHRVDCQYCPQQFRLQRDYKNHLKEVHDKPWTPPKPATQSNNRPLTVTQKLTNLKKRPESLFRISCPFCPAAEFKTKADFNVHVKKVHESPQYKGKEESTRGVAQVDSDDDRLSIDMDRVKEVSSESENEELRRAVSLIS